MTGRSELLAFTQANRMRDFMVLIYRWGNRHVTAKVLGLKGRPWPSQAQRIGEFAAARTPDRSGYVVITQQDLQQIL